MLSTLDTYFAPFDALPSNASATDLAAVIADLITQQPDRNQAVATTAAAYAWLARQAERARPLDFGATTEAKARYDELRDVPYYLFGMLQSQAKRNA